MTGSVAITGGFGYLGGRIATHLAAAGHPIRLLTRNPGRPRPPWSRGFEVAGSDLANPALLEAAFEGISVVVHLAGMNARECAADPAAAERVNVGGTEAVMRATKAAGVARIVYFSTSHVYAAPLAGSFDETSPLLNSHPYAASHARAEAIVRARPGTVVFRPSNGIGSPMDAAADCWMLITNDLCRQAIENGRLALRGTGHDRRDFIPIAEICRAVSHVLALPTDALGDGLFNLASGRSLSTLDLARLIAVRTRVLLGVEPSITHAPDDGVRLADVKFSTGRFAATGFVLAPDLAREIDATLAFCRDTFPHA